jgi:4-diphosphocytidyl-2-C-methyl-D-erythritol kinase
VVEVAARAKINLYLAVGPRGPDGYHDVATVLQTVDLADTLVLRPAASTGEAGVRFTRGPGYAGALPEPPDLVARALELAVTELSGAVPTAAEVAKQIPMAAGLAGGSADAAAALLGADALAGADTPRGQLEALCRRLGSDVAFCLRGGTALGRGRGDQLSPLACRHGIWWVLGISEFPLATVDVYRRFDERAGASAPAAGDPAAGLGRPNRLADALAAGHPKAIAPLLHNDLEAPALDLAPLLAGRKQAMLAAGALNALVSGSGPTIAGLCRNEAHAEEVAARAGGEFPRVEVVASTPLGAEILAREP